ncbi:hypothetical protein SY88_09925 [Clostridiales bacterium PH28_bin88]|nr:hypothetical protein SY88_09925 [Clostridiales bacterium PH28_bin88]
MARKKKLLPLAEAASLVKDGDRVFTGGWTVVRKPMGLVYELIRQGRKDLHLVSNPGGPEIDLLVGAGCVSLTETNYIGHEVFGHPYCFRRKIEEGASGYHHDDWTVQTGALRILAGAMGLPFLPTFSLKGSDIINPELDPLKELRGVDPRLPKQKVAFIRDPFWEGQEMVLVPALRPDVCLIHAQEAGEEGTVRIRGGAFMDYYAAMASKVTIVTAETIVPEESLRDLPEANTIPAPFIHAVVELPYGAHPTAVRGFYDNDPWWFKDYLAASKEEEAFQSWLGEWVLGVRDHDEYLGKVGLKRLLSLKADTVRGYNPNIRRRLDRLREVKE